MKKRIGKDLVITWSISTNGQFVSLVGRDLTLFLKDPRGNDIEVKDFSIVDGNKIRFRFKGIDQTRLGMYALSLWEYYGKVGQTVVDSCDGFKLVSTTCQEDDNTNGLDADSIEIATSSIEVSFYGPSAYEVAVQNGFVGTEKDWLASLHGKDGASAYQSWILAGNEGTEEDFLNSLKGAKGESAYEQWLAQGYQGSEADFIASLKGEKGDSGNINYPTFRIDAAMHLQMNTESASNKDRFKINDNGNLILRI